MPEGQTPHFVTATILRNADLGGLCRHLVLALPDTFPAAEVQPGQFLMVRGPWGHHPMLPRAFSILEAVPGRLEILNKVVGRGTALLAGLPEGATVTVLGPLGRPFPPSTAQAVDLLLGGGSGIPPLALQAARARAAGLGERVEVIYGGRRREDLPLLARLEALGVALHACTEDGSHGTRGRVTDVLLERLPALGGAARVLACGPLPMLRAVSALCRERGVPCWLSLETEMACGVGICRGCMVHRAGDPGYLCTCLEGPVVRAEEVSL